MPKKPPREPKTPEERDAKGARQQEAKGREGGRGRKAGEGECPPRQRKGEARYPDPRRWEKPPAEEPVATGEPARPPQDGEWRDELDGWVAERKKEREAERERDECGRDRGKRRMPRPWLDATSVFAPQIAGLPLGAAGDVTFTVWNEGSFPAWTCYVEVYEGPGGYTSPLSDYALRGRRIITLHPGERRDVTLPWIRERPTGRIVGVVYDPLLDPRDFDVVEQFNRHITSVHYVNLD